MAAPAYETFAEDGFLLGALLPGEDGRPADVRILRVNRRFRDLTGLDHPEGRRALDLAPRMAPRWLELFGRVAAEGRAVRVLDRGADGTLFDVLAAPAEAPGQFAVLFRPAPEIAPDPGPAEPRELAHRVMNGFAALGAMAAIEARAAPPEARAALGRMQARIQAMGALFRQADRAAGPHRAADAADAADALGAVIAATRATLGAEVEARLAPLPLPRRAHLPLGLALAELLLGAAGAAPGARLRVTFATGPVPGEARLCVEGAPDAAGKADPGLAAAFAVEFGGRVESAAGVLALVLPLVPPPGA
jgi:hypothetical protein